MKLNPPSSLKKSLHWPNFTKLSKPKPTTSMEISLDWQPVPYLTIKENLLLGATGTNHSQEKELQKYAKLFRLSTLELAQMPQQLAPLESYKLQLIHGLLLKKRNLHVMDLSKRLTANEMKHYLWLLRQANHTNCCTLIIKKDN
ncbi:MAG: hypothetical protein ACK5MW_05130 [Enterococcus sp.]